MTAPTHTKPPARERLDESTLVLRSERFTLVLKRLAPGKILLTGIGYEDGGTFDALTAELQAEADRAPGGVTIYCDLWEETGMSPDSRERWGKWSRDTARPIVGTHILVRSKIVDMAISLIGLFVGGSGQIQSYADPQKLERVIARDVPGFRGLPRYPELVAERARKR